MHERKSDVTHEELDEIEFFVNWPGVFSLGFGDTNGIFISSPARDVSKYTDATHSTDLTRMLVCTSSSVLDSLPSLEP